MNAAAMPRLMVTMAQSRSLPEVLGAIVRGIAECRHVALVRIWLIAPGDICSSCRHRSECPDRTLCLHLAASAGNASGDGADHTRLDGAFRRFPLGLRKIGRVAASGEAMVARDVRGDEAWIADPDWVRGQAIRTFAAEPLQFRGDTLGVIGLFDRSSLTDDQLAWLRVCADHAAVSIANARAFDEIERLRARLEEENAYLRDEVTAVLGAGDIIGESPGLRKVLQQIQLVAPTDATVLVSGESGTGKELVARAIHDNSPRKARAFIKVNCAAITEALFESEFFGHVKGAFTGAIRDKPGRFELADGGTLLLDEIGEVTPAMQTKLLRVLQEQEIERVGDTRTRKVDVRIIAATNRDLKREVDEGRFRQDLFYRLSVFPIDVPPLRDRREDIVPLSQHFAAKAAKRLNRPLPRLSAASARELAAYDWPGNVREMQNAVERAMILARNGSLVFELAGLDSAHASRAAPPSTERTGVMTRAELKRCERDSITAALRASGGKVFGPGGAAEMLGMRPTTLSSRIKKLGLAAKNP